MARCTVGVSANVTDVSAFDEVDSQSSSSWTSYLNPFKMLYVPSLASTQSPQISQTNKSSSSSSQLLRDSLSQHSLILLLLIANQRVNDKSNLDCYSKLRQALFKFSHIGQTASGTAEFELDLQHVYRWLAGGQHLEAATLFLYTLIHQNSNVKAYILSRMDLDTIVMRERDKNLVRV